MTVRTNSFLSRNVPASLALILMVMPVTGCARILGLDEYELDPCVSTNTDEVRDVRLELGNLSDHQGENLRIELVGQDGIAVTQMLLEGITLDDEGKVALTVLRALPAGVGYTAHIYIDENTPGEYTGIEDDPSWVVGVCASGLVQLTEEDPKVALNQSFTVGSQPLRVTLNGYGIHQGGAQMLEFALVDNEGGTAAHTVGYYRIFDINLGEIDFKLPHVVFSRQNYEIEFYVDANQSGSYDDPPTDHTWHLDRVGDSDGIELDFLHDGNWENLDSFP